MAAAAADPCRKWRVAVAVISTCRALFTLIKKELSSSLLLLGPSYVAISIHPHDEDDDDNPLLPLLDRKLLSSLVKEKLASQVSRLGGPRGLAAALASHPHSGVSDAADAAARRDRFGSNTYPRPPSKPLISYAIDPLKDFFLLILIACALLSLAFGIKEHGLRQGWYDGASIFLAVFLVSAVSAVSNYRQDRRFDRLSSQCADIRVAVTRAGRRQEASIFDIVVGDVVCLNIGDQVPADGLVLEPHSLKLDESSMTGESEIVDVDEEANPFLASGVKVADGYGLMLVTAVGMDTGWGEMMSTISSAKSGEETPLQQRLNSLSSSIGKIGIAVAAVVLAVLTARYFTGSTRDEYGNSEFVAGKATANSVISALVTIVSAAVTIVVVAVPEGLPLAVTLTLAYSMKRMMKDNAMVRNLSACETMGSATTICTDKTGTLTMNQMKVTSFWVGREEIPATAAVASRVVELLHQGVGLNTTGNVFIPESSDPEFSGSPTEKAILSWGVMELKMQFDELKQNVSVIHVEAFNSAKKQSGVLLKQLRDDGKPVAHWKGAAEMVLSRCSAYYSSDGRINVMDLADRMALEDIIKDMAAQSLRCVAFAYKEMEEGDIELDEHGKVGKFTDEELTLLGFVGLKDPCRPEVIAAVEACRSAGVDIKMITGDNVFTARAIAIECGILRSNGDGFDGIVVEGQQFRSFSPEERMRLVDQISVMARSSPSDKLLMVQCLKQKGHVVAVTGDGTNDAPALKEADVGLSMGIQGTEVAKESSDIVIMDDNFDTVVAVIRWGRCVYNNIQKFIQFQLTVNVAALVINFVSAISSGKVPLTTVQLLWVNLIMDTLGALALATESPTNDLMKKPPVGRTEPLISNVMWRNLTAQALFQIAILLVFQFAGKSIFGITERVNNTMIFNTFVFCQVFNEFNSRKLEKKNVFEGIHKNRLFLGIVVVTVVLQVVMVEFLKKFAQTERLDSVQWSICISIAAFSWVIGWVVKFIQVPETPIYQLISWKKFL